MITIKLLIYEKTWCYKPDSLLSAAGMSVAIFTLDCCWFEGSSIRNIVSLILLL